MQFKRQFIVGLLSTLALLQLGWLSGVEQLDYKGLDLFRTRNTPHPNIVILAVDNKSLQAIGRWPWDRKVHAQIVTALSMAHPRVIVYDVNFFEPQNSESDAQFAQSLEKVSFPVVLASQPVYYANKNTPAALLTPLPELKTKTVTLGHSEVLVGGDAVARVFPTQLQLGVVVIHPLAVAGFLSSGGSLPAKGMGLLDFAGPASTFTTVSVSDLLSGKVSLDIFKDAFVLIGATAPDLHDVVLTPVGLMSGVEWQATVFDNLLLNRVISVVPLWHRLLLGLVLGLTVAWVLARKRIRTGFVIASCLVVLLVLVSWVLWLNKLALPFSHNLIVVGGVFSVSAGSRWYESEKEKRKMRAALSHYFSPQVLDHVLRHPEELQLGGKRAEVTIFFSDIRSFTTISESTPPEVLTQVLHEYFTEMTQCILETDGVIDKFIGDAIMAFWGAPFTQTDQADRAIKASLAMLKKLPALQKKWHAKGWPIITIGIGLNTGVVTVGNMGSRTRFDYTVIGDAVNLASRLESATKEFKVPIVIGENTKNKVISSYTFKPLGSTVVKGKTEAVNVYTVDIPE